MRIPHAACRYFCETGAVRAALKFLTPLRGRHPTSLPLMLMLGHCHLLNLQYAEALGQYFHAYRRAAAARAAAQAQSCAAPPAACCCTLLPRDHTPCTLSRLYPD